jgi:Ti-type conjugative transfer relaxase TraA
VTAAHDAAVDAAVGYLERAAGYTRRGAGGVERVEVEGFVAAGFRHRVSRANDPLLHTHVLVANLARTCDDGVWRTLDSRGLFAHAKTAGYLYQAHLRHELTRRVSVEWAPVTNGYADVAGVERDWIDHFSRRRTQIVEALEARGESSAKAAQVATLETRPAKGRAASEAELRAFWGRRAREIGVERSWPDRLLGRRLPQRPDVGGLYDELVVAEGLTAQASTFTRRDLLQRLAESLPTGAPVESVEELADAFLAHDPEQIIALGAARGHLSAVDTIRRVDGSLVAADVDEARYTTPGLLLTEQRAVDRARARLHEGAGAVAPATGECAVGRRSLSGEQAQMVRQLTASGHGVEVVVGRAGTGKTYALDAAREAWSCAGYQVRGVALAARAALELEDSAGIASTTVAALLARIDDPKPGSPLAPGSVLVVDEAGMVGTRALARLLDHAEARQVKVVLVGDPRQLPEIDAGGLFRALSVRLPAVELTHNRRQADAWEAGALEHLRDGDPALAVAAYRDHGRIITADTAEAVREQLVADWWEAFDQLGSTSAVMVALRRADVDDLNARARARLLDAGDLTGPTLEVDETVFQAGDRIVCLRNHRRLGVVNGTRATITGVHPRTRSLDAVTDDGRTIRLPADYLDAAHVTHGYAITGHKAQGLTVDRTFVLGSPALYREWGYVALSRGRHSNRLYVCAGDDHLDDLHHHTPAAGVDPITSLTTRLDRSRAQQPLTDTTPTMARELVDLGVRWRDARDRFHHPAVARRRELAEQYTKLVADRSYITSDIDHLTIRLDDTRRGLGRVRRRNQAARLEADLTHRRTIAERLDTQIADIERELARLPSQDAVEQIADDYRTASIDIHQQARHRAQHAETAPPAYLAATIGSPPDDGDGRDRWRRAARTIEQYRIRWNIDDPHRALGDQPAHPAARYDHQHAVTTITAARDARQRTRDPGRGLARGLSLGR